MYLHIYRACNHCANNVYGLILTADHSYKTNSLRNNYKFNGNEIFNINSSKDIIILCKSIISSHSCQHKQVHDIFETLISAKIAPVCKSVSCVKIT